MDNNLIASWQAEYSRTSSTVIIPDGCRDLIVKTLGNGKPNWFVSELFDSSELVQIEANSQWVGFRLSPGAQIKEQALLEYIEAKQCHAQDVESFIGEFVSSESSIEEALECFACDTGSIKQSAAQLGVSVRTLQRLVLHKTNRTPSYWLQLARLRKAARSLTHSTLLADVAHNHGFSDQSHMNREFQRWLGLTPVQLLSSPAIIKQLNSKGYA
ncbi:MULTISPECIES: helix-turn-helix domain-containing protein [Pseudoalteromonas]|uniref:HTH araC/xylS-type domain-containing protein n=1 Tax=Pseudoalteromonas amylolytica TaxID=1859457 RepID=A0A1S1MQ76_9GAMM|nr:MULTISPECIES: helix-turn-helix domain-containing protein [Pseudoalteromonas]OHU85805.1 hypothetical protein BFC16_18065 [Pseudoalteromonas sp. JW3]OHU87293.1 hypothetical protein BET10_20330 [Pseudoalteromonas amylolytica]